VRAAFANQGQICLCGSRLFVEKSAHAAVMGQFVERVKALKVGDPLDPATEFGAVTSKQHYEKVMSYIDLAKREGGTILCGGGRPNGLPDRCRDGYFIEPTVITGLDARCRVNQEEIFGPVVTIMPFERDADVIEMANSVEYGLSASVWTRDLDRAHHVAAQLHSGTVWINCWLLRDLRVPFGGMKNSGVGREGGEEAIRFFTEPKNVCISVSTSTL
jgi:aminomuconate-semialdehyde/2-hydroxymuconate-6-semialdehyde dehydrogenase